MTFSTQRVAELTGASYRRLDHWVRHGVVGPKGSGSGSRRAWSAGEVLTAAVVRAASDAVNSARPGEGLGVWSLRHLAGHYEAAGFPTGGFVVVSRQVAEYLPTVPRLVAFLALHEAAVVVDLASALSASALRAAIGGTASAGVDSGAAGPSAVGRGGPPPRVRPTAAGHPPAPGGSHPETHDPRGRVLADSHEGR